ncbi:MAG: myo-inosose-2 dehydratase [Proteobacteria bacterium]|nr:myo-inosose-2 dehydratase [Pseudomonadota bacterium]
MQFRIGINPLTWTNDDMPELGGDISLEQCLSEARQAGYQGIELGHKFPRDPERLEPLLRTYQLSLISGWYSGRLLDRTVEQEIAAMTPHLDLLCAMGCEVVVFAEITGCVHGKRQTPLSRRPRLSLDEYKDLGERLTRIAQHCGSRGLRLSYHHHMGTVVETESEVDALMAHSGDSVFLVLDTGHIFYAGGDPVAVARRYGTRIAHVHCKDVRPRVLDESRKRDRSFLDSVLAGVFTVPGDGCIDYASLLPILRDAGYSGWLVVEAEQDPAQAHPLTYATMGYRHLQHVSRQP